MRICGKNGAMQTTRFERHHVHPNQNSVLDSPAVHVLATNKVAGDETVIPRLTAAQRRHLRNAFHRCGTDLIATGPFKTLDDVDLRALQSKILSEARTMADQLVVSHTSAWILHNLPVPWELGYETSYVCVPEGTHRIRRRNVKCVQRTSRPEVQNIDGVLVTTPRQTWLDLGHLKTTLATYVGLGDALVGRSSAKLAGFQRFMSDVGSCKGVRFARIAVPFVRAGAESLKESETRLRIVAAGLPEPELNQNVYRADGQHLARADMLYRDARVVVEYDGAYHGLECARRRDASRRNALVHEGWRVLTVTQSSFSDPRREWLDQLRSWLNG